MHVKVSDTVEVLAGDDRGVRAEVLTVDRKAGKVIVQGVNLVYKHVRRSQAQSPRRTAFQGNADPVVECQIGLSEVFPRGSHGCSYRP